MDINEVFASLYETIYFSDPFSTDLFQENLYLSLGIIGVVISLFLVISFYFIINRPHFSRWYHWLIMLTINFIIAFVIGIILPRNKFIGLGLDYEISEYIVFGLMNALITTVFFIIWTYALKWWTGAAKGTPKIFFGKF